MAELCIDMQDGFAAESIHKFRVQLKSLRAFIGFLATNEGQTTLKIPKHVKRVYKTLGKIRDGQLQTASLVQQQLAVPTYIARLNDDVKASQKKWHANYSPKKMERFSNRYDDTSFAELTIARLTTYLVAHMQAVNKISRDVMLTDARIHELRKLLKDILYVTEIVKEDWPEGKKLVKQWPLKQIAQLATDIGSYRDSRIAMTNLAGFANTSKSKKEAKATRAYNDEAVVVAFENKKEIVGSLKALVISAKAML